MLEVEVVEGDITALEVDAIANAANNHLWMGAGVAGAIKRAGGEEIEREAVAKGPIPLGSAVATSAGRLSARWVLHGAVMGQDLRTSADLIERTTRSCLQLAEELGCGSVALPAFGTGVGGFPLDECARIMVRVAREHQPETSSRVVKLPVRAIADATAQENRRRHQARQILFALDGVHGLGVEAASIAELGCDFLIAGHAQAAVRAARHRDRLGHAARVVVRPPDDPDLRSPIANSEADVDAALDAIRGLA